MLEIEDLFKLDFNQASLTIAILEKEIEGVLVNFIVLDLQLQVKLATIITLRR